ncbi:MAG: metallophosphoesterase [Ignavibacteriae bacterium]|nr:metallophosphoesterase [Ignavibacteriota bacterium]
MKKQFLIFFGIVILIFAALQWYLYTKGAAAFADYPQARTWYTVIFTVCAWAYLAGRVLERVMYGRLTSVLVHIGSLWLGAMIYLLLLWLCVDVIGLVMDLASLQPPEFLRSTITPLSLFLVIHVLAAGLVVYGWWNARSPHITTLTLDVQKKSSLPSIVFAVASDIHLGTVISHRRPARIVECINGIEADCVLLPGDVIDEDLRPVVENNLGEMLRTIRARHGVYAVTGNHEFIGGADASVAYLEEHGITVLRDSCVLPGGLFTLAGREDRSVRQFAGRGRASLVELLRDVDHTLPLVLMDHQPFRLSEAVEAGVDLQLSGHTHHGQLWPFHWITQKIFEVSWGYRLLGRTHVYVSSGAGFWGPPMRIGNTPEVVKVTLRFVGSAES